MKTKTRAGRIARLGTAAAMAALCAALSGSHPAEAQTPLAGELRGVDPPATRAPVETRDPGARRQRRPRAETPATQPRRAPTSLAPVRAPGTTGYISTNDPRERLRNPPPPLVPRPPNTDAWKVDVGDPPKPGAEPAPKRPAVYRLAKPKPRPGPKRPNDPALLAPAAPGVLAVPEVEEYDPRLDPKIPKPDPFAPLGLRLGTFTVKPAIETTLGYDSNVPRAETDRKGAAFTVLGAEIDATSDWSRHEVKALLRGGYTLYHGLEGYDRPDISLKIDGRFDVTRDTRIETQLRSTYSTLSAYDPNNPVGGSKLTPVITYGGTLGVARDFGRLTVALRGALDRTSYGAVDSFERDGYITPAIILRGSYALSPSIKPFVEATFDRRIYDHEFDTLGVMHESTGQQVKAGIEFDRGPLTGEFGIGWQIRRYPDPTLPDISGLLIDGRLVWKPTGLTTLTLRGTTTVEESILPGISGTLRRDLSLTLEHAFRRYFVANAKIAVARDDYVGSTRTDDRLILGFGADYKVGRAMIFRGEYRHEIQRSNLPGNGFVADVMMLSLRLQR